MNNRKTILYLLILVAVSISVSYKFLHPVPDMVHVKAGDLHTIDPLTGKEKVVPVNAFAIDKHLVTVSDFQDFVRATNYKTEAETFGNAAVFDEASKQWSLVDGANFLYPQGPAKPKAQPDHPVTQVSWNDANAFAKWKKKRLPSQWEWEHAANNGDLASTKYSWGENLREGGNFKANTWQGSFPYLNTAEDGYRLTSPVGAFGENRIGLTDMGGNVWQWCQDDIEAVGREREVDPSLRKVMRGGSFLCDPNVCHGFLVTGRSSSTPESSLMHTGFRCARDL